MFFRSRYKKSWHKKRHPPNPYAGGWGWRGPPRRKRWGLRRRLTFAFAFVALMAVSLTTFLTLGAVFGAQQELFSSDFPFDTARSGDWHDYNWEGFAPARAAFGQITRTAFFAGLLSFFLASMTAALLTRALTRPLLALTDGARRLGAGERGLQLRVPRSRDELRTLTEAFNGLVTGLEQQDRWRRDLVADIAHDLRTPLSVMRSELEAMQDGVVALDDASLARLHTEVLTLSRLVTGLRELSLAEGGGLPLKRKTLQLEPFLVGVCNAFQSRAADAGVALTLREVSPALTVTADPDQLARVLGNLIDNALRYAAPGAVEISGAEISRVEPSRVESGAAKSRSAEPDASRAQGGVTIWVRDHGPGVPGDAERLFERFFRGDSSRTRDAAGEKGSGLGLSIARAIAQAHGGSLRATNHPAGGAVFSLTLPGEA